MRRIAKHREFMEHEDRVYFVRGKSELVKIGTTTAFRNRIRELRCPDGGRVTVLAHMPGGRDVEQRLHKHLKAHRVTGEWFNPHPEVLEWIAYCLRHFDQTTPRGPVKNGSTYHLASHVKSRWPAVSDDDAHWIADDRQDIAHLLYKGCIRKEHRATVVDQAVADYIERADKAWISRF